MTAGSRLAAAACLVAAGLRAGGAAGQAPLPPDTYSQQLSVRLFGAVAQPDLFSARLAVHEENVATRAAGWTGSVPDSDLRRALGGGLEISYGFLDDLKLLVELGGFGSAAAGTFTGVGPNSVVDPILGLQAQKLDRLSRFPVFSQAIGATILLRSFEWCRFGLTFRLSVNELAAAVERSQESGPFGPSWSNASLSATAPAALLGLEWEWLSLADTLGFPMSGWVMVGYRELLFDSITATFTDSTGARTTSELLDADGGRMSLDMSGPEARVGIQIAISFAPTP